MLRVWDAVTLSSYKGHVQRANTAWVVARHCHARLGTRGNEGREDEVPELAGCHKSCVGNIPPCLPSFYLPLPWSPLLTTADSWSRKPTLLSMSSHTEMPQLESLLKYSYLMFFCFYSAYWNATCTPVHSLKYVLLASNQEVPYLILCCESTRGILI